jgi:hypothetical protein
MLECIASALVAFPLPAQSQEVARFQSTVITQDELAKVSADDLAKLELQRSQFARTLAQLLAVARQSHCPLYALDGVRSKIINAIVIGSFPAAFNA